jgi:hypothetical protein
MSRTVDFMNSAAAPQVDIDGIVQAITDYMEPWYGAGHEKLAHAIHPTIVKRKFYTIPRTGVFVLRQVNSQQLIELAKDTEIHPRREDGEWRCDIVVYDIFENIATAKSIGSTWTDYIHLAKLDGRWQIMHILFDNPREDVPPADDAAINQTIRDYMESWYCYEAERLAKSFHPALVKRGFYPLREGGATCISISTVSEMVERVKSSSMSGRPLRPKSEWIVEIEIYDIYQQIATAKAVGDGWVDYLHLADVNGEWKLVNILYDRPSNYS